MHAAKLLKANLYSQRLLCMSATMFAQHCVRAKHKFTTCNVCPAGERWSADHYLTSWPRQLFPQHFSEVLHPFFNALLDMDPDARLAAAAAHYEEIMAAICSSDSGSTAQQVRLEG
jgi:hypothetical protein